MGLLYFHLYHQQFTFNFPAVTLFLPIVLASFDVFVASLGRSCESLWTETLSCAERNRAKIISIPRSSLYFSVTTFCISAGIATNFLNHNQCILFHYGTIQGIPLATEPGISLIILPLMRIIATKFEADFPHCVRNVKERNVLLFKFRGNIFIGVRIINPLNPELNPICYLLALLGTHHFLRVSRIRVKLLTFRLLMSYIYIYIWSTHS